MEGHSQDGVLTTRLAAWLRSAYECKGFRILSDHGKKSADVGNIVSSMGKPGFGSELSQLDIAIVEPANPLRAIVLIEIEETNDKPKTLLGDAFATLIGDHVSFRGDCLEIGERTTLLVLAHATEDHTKRNEFLRDGIEAARPGLRTGNKNIGKIFIESFADEKQLKERALARIDEAISSCK